MVQWSRQHGFKLNATKTQAIIIGSPYNIKRIDFPNLQPLIVNGRLIPFSEPVKNLGLVINSTLRWDEHIQTLITKTNKTLFFLFSKCCNLPINLKKQLVSQLLFPQFDYVCTNFLDLSKELETKLQTQLN